MSSWEFNIKRDFETLQIVFVLQREKDPFPKNPRNQLRSFFDQKYKRGFSFFSIFLFFISLHYIFSFLYILFFSV